MQQAGEGHLGRFWFAQRAFPLVATSAEVPSPGLAGPGREARCGWACVRGLSGPYGVACRGEVRNWLVAGIARPKEGIWEVEGNVRFARWRTGRFGLHLPPAFGTIDRLIEGVRLGPMMPGSRVGLWRGLPGKP